jgi:hypothetical protein
MQKHVLRVLGLSLLAVVGLMAFASAGAQAIETKGKVLVLTKEAVVGQGITGELEGTNNRLLVPALGIEIRCPTIDVLEGKIIKVGVETEGLAVILYLGCEVFSTSTGEKIANCHVLDNSGTEKDITAKAIIKIDLLGTPVSTLLIASPDGQAFFAKIKFTPGLGCTLATPIEIKGEVGFRVAVGSLQKEGKALEGTELKEAEKVKVLIESSEAIQKSHPGVIIKYGANEAFVDGSALLALSGTNVGCTWGIL